MGRRTDEQLLLDLVPPDRAISNLTLLKELKSRRHWSDEKYWRVRNQLVQKGLLLVGRGPGGSVRKAEAPEPEESEPSATEDVSADLLFEEEEEDEADAQPEEGADEAVPQLPALKQVRFEFWKSFQNATLQIDSLMVLIGTNASGKSNALDGLQFLNRTAVGKELAVALGGDPTLAPLRGGVEWAALQGASQFAIEVVVSGEDSRTDYVYRITVDVQPFLQLYGESLRRVRRRPRTQERPYEISLIQTEAPAPESPSITARLYNGKGGTKKEAHRSTTILSQLAGQLVGLRLPQEVVAGVGAIATALKGIFILDPIPSGMRGFSPLSESLRTDAANVAGVLAALPKEQKAEVEATLTGYIRKLPERDVRRVWAEPVGRFRSDAMLYCEEAWTRGGPPTTVDARGMSDGTLRMLAIITALLTRPRGSVLVIEEVDNGLHPSRSELLLRMLRELGERRQIDVLVTTHNPALLDALGPEMIPFITVAHRDPETGESLLTLLEDLTALPKLMA
ncbi:MAG TPA: ATP-binding protein, partial [Candidatus Nanopelagicales bacterium]|nr:ATP-binding protein [Candidatus Nanopelagicales bacterium]